MTDAFTAAERDLIRREFGAGWGEPRPLAAGIWLRRWASGPRKGAPKLPKAVQTMLDCSLVTIDDAGHWPVARFTAAGLAALRAMAADARQFDSARFGLLLEELRRGG